MSKVRFLGLDVHAMTIAVAVAEPAGEVRSLGTIQNRFEAVRKLIQKLGPAKQLRACYEAGPTGYVLYWQLVALGVDCQSSLLRLFRPKPVIASRPTGAMLRNWRVVSAPVTSRPCGFPTQLTKRFATWFGPVRMPEKTNTERGNGSANSCSVMVGIHRTTSKPSGPPSI